MRFRAPVHRSIAAKVAVSVGTASIVAVSGQGIASANTKYPSNCQPFNWIGSQSWNANCYVGYSFANNSPLVAAVQSEMKSFGYSPAPYDGLYDSHFYNEVVAYQAAKGLTQDGIIGSATWGQLKGELVPAYTLNNENYYTVRTDSLVTFASNPAAPMDPQPWLYQVPGTTGSPVMTYSW